MPDQHATPRLRAEPASYVAVHSLLCHQHVDMGTTCFEALLRHSQQPVRLRIHDDGSLTERDVERLRSRLPDATFIMRRDADPVMEEVLRDFPAAAQYRRQHPLGIKLLDIVHFADDETVAYSDSDVLFMRPFSNVFALPDESTGALFMSDVRSAYSLRELDAMHPGRVQVPQKINTGLFVMRKAIYDLARVEWFLGQKRYDVKPFWREQTCFAMLGMQGNCRVYDPRQIVVLTPRARPAPQVVAGHFVTSCRHMMTGWAATAAREPYQEVARVGTLGVKRFGPFAAAGSLVSRVARRAARMALPQPGIGPRSGAGAGLARPSTSSMP